jgi:hypothetical protein
MPLAPENCRGIPRRIPQAPENCRGIPRNLPPIPPGDRTAPRSMPHIPPGSRALGWNLPPIPPIRRTAGPRERDRRVRPATGRLCLKRPGDVGSPPMLMRSRPAVVERRTRRLYPPPSRAPAQAGAPTSVGRATVACPFRMRGSTSPRLTSGPTPKRAS